ncbi:MAG TPA: S24 family peptidase [Dissulfurispiraceae bacterium]|nr:S24 family peptidase [Dissulfurispiraceae bacterium]
MGDRIRKLRLDKGWTQEELGKHIGLQKAAIQKYEKGYVENIKRPNIKRLAEALGVTATYLMGLDDAVPCIAETPAPYSTYSANLRLLPVLGVVRAGAPLFADENIIGYEPANANEIKNGDYFYLRVTGDSMTGSRIQEGDLVLVKKQNYIENGQVAVVMVNTEEATLKRVYTQNEQYILQADNPKYPPVAVSASELSIIGRVIGGNYKL